MSARQITFVKKILADGQPCGKCRDVEQRLTDGDYWHAIDRVVVADERDPNSDGIQLGIKLGVERAPFFVVEYSDKTVVYTVFLKFIKDVIGRSNEAADAELLLASHPDLDLI